MGIPSYFSYIVKNHPDIIKRYLKDSLVVDNLYLDCNSIIYDCVHKTDFSKLDSVLIAKTYGPIITSVIQKIESYLTLIAPKKRVFIAFDGVAPVAKLQQQRERRYKAAFTAEMNKQIFKDKAIDAWNTAAITPGTEFMCELNARINDHFSNTPENRYKCGLDSEILVSTTDEVGEGEHKLFQYIRENPDVHASETTVIYGLDADLIMLSINHLPVCPQIYLFRETPHFIQSIDSSLEPDADYFLDIPALANIITESMSQESAPSQVNRVYDYIFICFFLGNDFMPHFPAVNIRTGGVDKVINSYKATVGQSTKDVLTDGKTIYWKNVRKFVEHLASLEDEYLRAENKLRAKRERNFMPDDTPERKYAKFEALPTQDRELEKYINPDKDYWQERYYKCLFKIDIDDERRRQISLNYLQGLEWTMKYYTTGCPDWRWCYQHHYPPLFQDLIKFIPVFDTIFVKEQPMNPVLPLTQLCYVLPLKSLGFLPPKLYHKLLREHTEWYSVKCDYIWAYCRYFWESHVELPEIDISELEQYIDSVVVVK